MFHLFSEGESLFSSTTGQGEGRSPAPRCSQGKASAAQELRRVVLRRRRRSRKEGQTSDDEGRGALILLAPNERKR